MGPLLLSCLFWRGSRTAELALGIVVLSGMGSLVVLSGMCQPWSRPQCPVLRPAVAAVTQGGGLAPSGFLGGRGTYAPSTLYSSRPVSPSSSPVTAFLFRQKGIFSQRPASFTSLVSQTLYCHYFPISQKPIWSTGSWRAHLALDTYVDTVGFCCRFFSYVGMCWWVCFGKIEVRIHSGEVISGAYEDATAWVRGRSEYSCTRVCVAFNCSVRSINYLCPIHCDAFPEETHLAR